MAVRLSADWMSKADDRILEYLEQEGPHSPGRIAESEMVRFSRKTINMRLIKLEQAGLVEKDAIGRGVYEISEIGEQYLTGDLDARELDEPE